MSKQPAGSPNQALQPTARSAVDYCCVLAITTVTVSCSAFLAAAEFNGTQKNKNVRWNQIVQEIRQ